MDDVASVLKQARLREALSHEEGRLAYGPGHALLHEVIVILHPSRLLDGASESLIEPTKAVGSACQSATDPARRSRPLDARLLLGAVESI